LACGCESIWSDADASYTGGVRRVTTVTLPTMSEKAVISVQRRFRTVLQ